MTTAIEDPGIGFEPTDEQILAWNEHNDHAAGAEEFVDEPDVSRETVEPAGPTATPRRRPGPPPNPNSARQRRKAAKAAKATPPRKRAAPNTSAAAAPPEPDSVLETGARAVISWAARPLAMAGLSLGLAAHAMPTQPNGSPTPKAFKTAQLGEALSLDSLTLTIHGPALAKGAAQVSEGIPWMAQALEKAAKISPFAALLDATSGVLLQCLANHGLVPCSPMLGTLTAGQLRQLAGLDEPAAAAS